MSLKKYKKILTSGRWSTKDPKYDQILALLGVYQKLVDESKKSSEISNTSNRDTTKGYTAYIRDLPPWILEDLKDGVGNKNKDVKEYWWCKEHFYGKVQWVGNKPEDHRRRTGTSSRGGGGNKTPSEGDSNKKLTRNKDFKFGLLSMKYQSNVQAFL